MNHKRRKELTNGGYKIDSWVPYDQKEFRYRCVPWICKRAMSDILGSDSLVPELPYQASVQRDLFHTIATAEVVRIMYHCPRERSCFRCIRFLSLPFKAFSFSTIKITGCLEKSNEPKLSKIQVNLSKIAPRARNFGIQIDTTTSNAQK